MEPTAPTQPTVLPATQAALHAGTAAVKEIKGLKPGYRTTEFWVTIVFNLIVFATTVFPPDSYAAKVGGLLASAFAILGYSHSRGLAKAGL